MTASLVDRFESARAVADAVLYEGYVLYPYRASSRKNQVRWQFGVLAPKAFSESDGSERWSMRTECLLAVPRASSLAVRVRCLQVQRRTVERATDSGSVPVGSLQYGGVEHVPWDEAVERVVDVGPVPVVADRCEEYHEDFEWSAGSEVELLGLGGGTPVGRVVRRHDGVQGRVAVAIRPAGQGVARVSVTVHNETAVTQVPRRRDDVLGSCLVAVHAMLATDAGTFLSLIDPPESARDASAACRNEGSFPVLIGDDRVVLASPIILYDHPEVAPESPGDLYDSTEIDEILALRVLTLTEEEKAEARATDIRAAAVIDRCETMPPEVWERLHGAVRGLGVEAPRRADAAPGDDLTSWWDPASDASADPERDSMWIGGCRVERGSKVRLRPSHRADAQDLFLAGMNATVAGVFNDVDGGAHLAVTLDDDPATAELSWQGRYLFFHPDEVEPLPSGGVSG